MGVLACNRQDCDNSMCDNLSYTYGYICRECMSELKGNVMVDIEEFMNTPKRKSNYDGDIKECWEKIIDKEFEER